MTKLEQLKAHLKDQKKCLRYSEGHERLADEAYIQDLEQKIKRLESKGKKK